MPHFYFIFWSVVSLIAAAMVVAGAVYLFSILSDIRDSLSKLEILLAERKAAETKKKRK